MNDGTPLADVFSATSQTSGGDPRDLEARLAVLCERARLAWPEVSLSTTAFVRHLGTHAKATPDPVAFLAAVHAEELYLACAVAAHDRAALEAFERDFMAHVPQYLVRVSVDRELAAEVKQRLRQVVIVGDPGTPKILEYSGGGALGGWLRITAVRTALNLLRTTPQRPATTDDPFEGQGQRTDGPLLVHDPELAYVHAQAQNVFRDAFSEAVNQLEAKERSLLRLHYVDGLTMEQLSRMFQTPRSTIARRVDEVRQLILAATERLLAEQHRLSPSEITSLIRGARSQLDLTLSQFLKN